MPSMSFMINNMLAPLPSDGVWRVYQIVSLVLLALMVIAAIVSIVIVLFQPGNSTGIDALGGSSETFFGKNKAKSMEGKLALATKVSAVVFIVCALVIVLIG